MAGVNFRTASKFASIVGNSASTSGSPSNATLLFTCPESHEAEIVFLMVANEATSTAKIGIQIYHADDTTYHFLVAEEAIAGNNHRQFIGGGPLFLHAGDKVLLFRHGGSDEFDATLSARLYFTPAKRL